MSDTPHNLASNPTGARFLVAGRWTNERPEDVTQITAIWLGEVHAQDIVTAIHQGKIEPIIGTPYGTLGLAPWVRRVNPRMATKQITPTLGTLPPNHHAPVSPASDGTPPQDSPAAVRDDITPD